MYVEKCDAHWLYMYTHTHIYVYIYISLKLLHPLNHSLTTIVLVGSNFIKTT